MKIVVALSAALLLTACQTVPTEPPRASAELKPTKGTKTFGEASFEQLADNKVRVSIFVQGLRPGQAHTVRLHEKGDCSSGDASSAGAPLQSANLPALQAEKNGRGKIEAEVAGLNIAPGSAGIIGRGIVVHAPDNARLACGVIRES